jgi:molybdate transport system regulatory protein
MEENHLKAERKKEQRPGSARKGNNEMAGPGPGTQDAAITERSSHARIISMSNETPCLDAVELSRLEQSFQEWVENSPRMDVRLSRKRIFLIFLLIRYTGAKLNEVLSLDPFRDIDHNRHLVLFGGRERASGRRPREVQIPEGFSMALKDLLGDPLFRKSLRTLFIVDPGHVRRKFYERAAACGFHKALGAPDAIRKSRAVELMQGNMPLPVVQRMLGHSTPNLTASYVAFSDDDVQQVAKFFVEKESQRKTSARNTFFGKVRAIEKGDIQSKIELVTMTGYPITTLITNHSLERLGLKAGSLISAEVKAPWVMLYKDDEEPHTTAENLFRGTVDRITHGKITAEIVVRIADGTELCSIITEESKKRLDIQEDDTLWVAFNAFAVVLHVD